MRIDIRVKKLRDTARLPEKANKHAACLDVYSDLGGLTQIDLYPGNIYKIATGIAMEIPEGYYGKLHERSGLAAKGVSLMGGVIDSDYRGEVFVVLTNHDKNNSIRINQGDRIAQLEIREVKDVVVFESENLSESDRGDSGFGSTGA